MKAVLVTGATGFVGRHVLMPLIEKNYTVHAIYFHGNPVLDHPSIIWHQVNLLDASAVDACLGKILPSHLLHLAWYAKPGEYWTSPENLAWLQASLHLLQTFSKNKGQRAVFVGSCAEYEWSGGPYHENTSRCVPHTLYGRAKYALYLLAEAMAHQHELSFAWGRLFYLFGPHEYPQRLTPSAIQSFLRDEEFTLNNGSQLTDFMYVKEAASALVALLDSEVDGAVNIASGAPLSVEALVKFLAEKMGVSQLCASVEEMQKKMPAMTADTQRLFNEVQWMSSYSRDKTLEETIDCWKKKNI